MADTCCGALTVGDKSSREARRRRTEIRKLKFAANVPPSVVESEKKRQKLDFCERSLEINVSGDGKCDEVLGNKTTEMQAVEVCDNFPKFGTTMVCGRRRDMEDAVSIHPCFMRRDFESSFHYFGVYDGHGCSHVSTLCQQRLYVLVKEELDKTETKAIDWGKIMERSFRKMNEEAMALNVSDAASKCRCQLRSPECDAVGSTAVVSVLTSDKLIIANCGDSRAVLCRNGHAIALSSDHKPDRPDELSRICAAGGRVVYWDGPRVLGVLAMSRAIGDNYLKPYVSCEPEVTSTDRSAEDECLILASDGLWDVVSNETACGVARMCLRGTAKGALRRGERGDREGETSDGACAEASMLLTKLALARHSSDNVSVLVVDLRKNARSYNY